MNQSMFPALPPGSPRQHRSVRLGVALLSGILLASAPLSVSAKEPAKESKAAAESNADSEARSKELLKKHFPLEEDIGPIPVVRVPKSDPAKEAAAKAEKARVEKARAERAKIDRARAASAAEAKEPKEGAPALATPGTNDVPETPIADLPKKVEAPKAAVVQAAPALGSEDNRQIDDLLSRALTEREVPAELPPPPPTSNLPPLGMDAIRATMQAVQPEVKRDCPLGRLGVVLVRVVVTPSGEVARVTPEGKLAKSPPASCIVDRVKRARFPKSAGGSFRYTLTVL
jgi:hypothetical protein